MPNVEIDGTNSTVKTNVLTSQSGTTITVPTGKVLTVTDAAGLTVNGVAPLTSIANDAVTTVKILNANVTTAKVADNAITLAKMAGGTDGQIITYDASGDPVAVGPGTSGQVLTSAGAGAPPTFVTAASDVVNDTTPQLGGDLDMNARSLNFEDTNTVSADPNFLDDYEEGTWTPVIEDNSHSQGESQTYNTQYGSYVKIGRKVFIDFYVNISSIGSISGSLYVGGLPFVNNNLAGNALSPGAYNHSSSALSLSGTVVNAIVSGNFQGNQSFLYLFSTMDVGLTTTQLTNAGNLGMSGNYGTNL